MIQAGRVLQGAAQRGLIGCARRFVRRRQRTREVGYVEAEGRICPPPQCRRVGIHVVFGVGEGMPQLVQRLAQIVARLSLG
jgi:hypothetical protein